MKIQTAKNGVYIRAGHSSTHKQGKLPKDVVLNTIQNNNPKAYELDPEHTKLVIRHYDPERSHDYGSYPNFWIAKADVIKFVGQPEPPPIPVPTPVPDVDVTDLEAAYGLAVFLKWLKKQ